MIVAKEVKTAITSVAVGIEEEEVMTSVSVVC